jgi:outer membrane receptor protein involved in Fe transport
MNRHVIIGAMVFLAGCTETRTTNEAQTTVRDVLNVTGQASGPGGMIFPVALRIERNGDTQTTEQAVSKTQIDAAAIAQQVGAVVGKLVDAGIAKVTGVQNQGEGGLATILGAAGGGTGILYGIQQLLARREEAQRHAVTRKARDDLFEKSLDLAKKLPPDSAT